MKYKKIVCCLGKKKKGGLLIRKGIRFLIGRNILDREENLLLDITFLKS